MQILLLTLTTLSIAFSLFAQAQSGIAPIVGNSTVKPVTGFPTLPTPPLTPPASSPLDQAVPGRERPFEAPYVLGIKTSSTLQTTVTCEFLHQGFLISRARAGGVSGFALEGKVRIDASIRSLDVSCSIPGYEGATTTLTLENGSFRGELILDRPSLVYLSNTSLSAGRADITIHVPPLLRQEVVLADQRYTQLVMDDPRVVNNSLRDNPQDPKVPTLSLVLALPLDAKISQLRVDGEAMGTTRGIRLGPKIAGDQANNPPVLIHPQQPWQQGFLNDPRYRVYRVMLPLVAYDPRDEALTSFRRLKVSLEFNSERNCFSLETPTSGDAVSRYLSGELSGYRRMVLNPRDLGRTCKRIEPGPNELPELGPLSTISLQSTSAPPPQAELLIIGTKAFSAAAQSLKVHKEDRGIRTAVLIGEFATAEALRAAIREQQKISINLKWVLLLGDVNILPTFYHTGLSPSDRARPAGDMYYTQIDPAASQPYKATLPATLSIGRLPVRDVTDMQRILSKIIAYESNPSASAAFYRAPTFAANLSPAVFGDQSRAAPDNYAEPLEFGVVKQLLARGYRPERIYASDTQPPPTSWAAIERGSIDVTALADAKEGAVPELAFHIDGQKALIDAAMARGASILTHRGHGTVDAWSTPDFDWSASWSIQNNEFPLVTSLNCLVGYFDNETITPYLSSGFSPLKPDGYTTRRFLGELLVLAPQGAIAFLGSNRTVASGFNQEFSNGLLGFLFEVDPSSTTRESRRLGELMNDAKLQARDRQRSSEAIYEKAFLAYNLLGDPSLEVQAYTPTYVADTPQVTLGDTSVTLRFTLRSVTCVHCPTQNLERVPVVVIRNERGELVGRALASPVAAQVWEAQVIGTGDLRGTQFTSIVSGSSVRTSRHPYDGRSR
jgi:hypothetical protein